MAKKKKQTAHHGRKPIYPWDKWTDGKQHTIKKGTHFSCPLKSIAAMLAGHARSRNLGFESTQNHEAQTVTFQFLKTITPLQKLRRKTWGGIKPINGEPSKKSSKNPSSKTSSKPSSKSSKKPSKKPESSAQEVPVVA